MRIFTQKNRAEECKLWNWVLHKIMVIERVGESYDEHVDLSYAMSERASVVSECRGVQ